VEDIRSIDGEGGGSSAEEKPTLPPAVNSVPTDEPRYSCKAGTTTEEPDAGGRGGVSMAAAAVLDGAPFGDESSRRGDCSVAADTLVITVLVAAVEGCKDAAAEPTGVPELKSLTLFVLYGLCGSA
jgi:hypothetical protein